MKRILSILLATMLVLSSTACTDKESGSSAADSESANDLGLTIESKPASEYTAQSNDVMYSRLDFDDKQEAESAERGLIDDRETLELTDEDGKVIWSQASYNFLDDYEEAPDTMNPSLRENTKNNHALSMIRRLPISIRAIPPMKSPI